jgi:nitrite reductase/ring-hydroxylating ferredoxin subunit
LPDHSFIVKKSHLYYRDRLCSEHPVPARDRFFPPRLSFRFRLAGIAPGRHLSFDDRSSIDVAPLVPPGVRLRKRLLCDRAASFGGRIQRVAGFGSGTGSGPPGSRQLPSAGGGGGSITLKVPGISPQIGSLIVTRLANDLFAAVSSICTHQGCTVGTFNMAEGAIVCPCHGSRYTADGQVLQGPAPRPLRSFRATLIDQIVWLEIPGLGFRLAVSPGGSGLLSLHFPTKAGVDYEVERRSILAIGGGGPAVPFLLSPDGEEQTRLEGFDGTATIYVRPEGDAGFYMIRAI